MSDSEGENTKKLTKRKGRAKTSKAVDSDNESIKSRLRSNSGSGTPRKARKDATSGSNAKQLGRMYEAEGRSMQTFLKTFNFC